MEDENGWNVWKKKVLSDTADTKEEAKQLRKDFNDFKIDVVSELKVIKNQISVRSGLWGAITGLLGSIGVILIFLAMQ
jgi:hypothetical protein